ncbi:MAG: endonuclease/exonuclease/phosphatase family protein, partial [Acidimicrobiia bacterium]
MEFAEVAMPLWAPLIVIALVALARVVRQAAPLVAGLSLSVLAIGCVLGPWRPVPTPSDSVRSDTALSLAVGNIRHQGGPELLAALRARDADVVVLAELSEDADRGLSLLYPYRLRSTQALRPWSTERLPRSQRANQAGVGVYSRYPLQELPDLTGLAQGL